MKITLKILFISIVTLLIGCFVMTMFWGYEKTMLLLLGDSPNVEKILNMVSPKKFLILQLMCVAVAAGFTFLLFILDRIILFFKSVYTFIKRNVYILLNELRYTEIKWLLIFPLGSSVFFAIVMPVSYDEAYTYLQFTSKSIFVSLSFYPLPNNHVLHSIITNITRYIPFLPILFCLRVSSIVVSFFTWLLCFSFLKKYYSKHISLLITGISSMLFMSMYYSYMSRGYGLVMLFFVLSFYTSYKIIFENDSRKNWLLFSVSNILGFFTMPSYLYVFIILNVFILWNNRLQLKKQFLYNVFTVFVVVILYMPIIIVNGAGALISNRFVAPISRTELMNQLVDFFRNAVVEITGVNYIFICFLLLISLALLIKFKMKFELKTFVVFIVSPFLLLIGHSVIPFPRTFNYYAVVLIFLVCIPYWKLIQEISVKYVIAVVLLIQLSLFLNFYFNIKKYETFNIPYHTINTKIVGNGSYFFSSDFFEINFLFENKIRGYMSSQSYNFPGGKVDTDTLRGFDYYVIDKKFDLTKNRKPVYNTEEINVYSK
ncbi:hypothetical protein [Cytophaga aurantiaca]|uniref:hypothetical protein n=1 Tax=Cytophaga aurantiaca TaxID=29530 RepID=UPI000524B7AC|nr:hypothetical protein [Cytophaga aurantiaca]